jgi:hypothetical protein
VPYAPKYSQEKGINKPERSEKRITEDLEFFFPPFAYSINISDRFIREKLNAKINAKIKNC